jgi:AraC-like DNA-binding protein
MGVTLKVATVTTSPQAGLWYQHEPEARPVASHFVPKFLPSDDLIAVEVNKLLEDVRASLHHDLDVASRSAGRLAALLASKLPKDPLSAPSRGGLAPWQERKVRNYIKERLESRLFVKDMAKLVALSGSRFCRAFKASFGEPPHAYVLRARMERARVLMLATPESLSQIALACGFADQAHLCRCFRRATGTSPGAWRRCQSAGA